MSFTIAQRRIATVAMALGIAATGLSGFAQDKTALVKERQQHMKGQGNSNKAINDYGKGRVPKAVAEKAIADLQARNAKTLSFFTDKSTSSTAMPGVSNAKANIWTDNAKFASYVTNLKTALDKQAALIKTGTPAQVGALQAELGKANCSGCHDTFREPEG